MSTLRAVVADADVTVMGVSIPIPTPYAEELQLKRASFGDPLALAIPSHVTLLGPTPVKVADLPSLIDHLDRAAAMADPFTMVLRGTGTFRPLSDVVFVQVAHGISACEQLQEAIRSDRWAADLDFPYHPHVTVAHDVDELALDNAFDDLANFSARFEVASFHLYEQDPEGTWIPAREFALGTATAEVGGMKQLWTRFQQTRGWRAWTRFGNARGNLLAAGIAFYGFFSIFPAAAIAAVVFGFVLRSRPDLLVSVGDSLNSTLPGFVKTAAHPDGLVELAAPKISVLTIGGVVALVGLVLSGLGWVGSLRDGIRGVFGVAGSPGNAVTVKLRDLGVLATLGFAVLVSAVLTSLTGAASGLFTAALGESTSRVVVMVVGLVLGFAVDTGIMVVLLRVLSGVPLPWNAIRNGAIVGGLGLTVVKAFGVQLISNATKNPLFGSIVLVIGLLFWLNLIAKLVLYAASWAANDIDRSQAALEPEAGAEAGEEAGEEAGQQAGAGLGSARGRAVVGVPAFGQRTADRTSMAAGAILGATVAVALGSVGRATRAVFTRR